MSHIKFESYQDIGIRQYKSTKNSTYLIKLVTPLNPNPLTSC